MMMNDNDVDDDDDGFTKINFCPQIKRINISIQESHKLQHRYQDLLKTHARPTQDLHKTYTRPSQDPHKTSSLKPMFGIFSSSDANAIFSLLFTGRSYF